MFELVDDPETDDPFRVYLEIEVGGKSDDKLLADLPLDIYFVQQVVREHFASQKRMSEICERDTVKIGCTEVQDFGFKDIPPAYADVWTRIRSLGHSLCRPSDALILRRALVQPVGDYLIVAMDEIICPGGISHIYALEQCYEYAPCLKVLLVRPNYKINLRTKVLYRLRK